MISTALLLLSLVAHAPVASSVVTVLETQAVPADAVKANAPFTFAFDHDGLDTDGYQLYINGAVVRTVGVAALVNGSVLIPFPAGLPKGTYTFEVHAYNAIGEGVGAQLTLSVTAGNPSNPKNPRIIKGGL